MANSRKEKEIDKIELDPDAWPRFEQFVRSLAKSPPKHRKARPEKPSKDKGLVTGKGPAQPEKVTKPKRKVRPSRPKKASTKAQKRA